MPPSPIQLTQLTYLTQLTSFILAPSHRRSSASIGGSYRRINNNASIATLFIAVYTNPLFPFFPRPFPHFPRFQSANAVFAPKRRAKTCENSAESCKNRRKTCKNLQKQAQNVRKHVRFCKKPRRTPTPNSPPCPNLLPPAISL